MAKIILNDKEYSVDESILAPGTAKLKSHLAIVMNGTGAIVNFGDTAYNVDSIKLETATNNFVSRLGSMGGSGSKVTVGGVEYSIDSNTVQSAAVRLEAILGTYIAGLYRTGTDILITSWDDLVANGIVRVVGGVVYYGDESHALDGDLILPSDGSIIGIGDDAFENCLSLTSIVIPDSVTSISGYAFEYCESLTSIVIPNSVTSIGSRAFDTCLQLTNITFEGTVYRWNTIAKGEEWNYDAGDYTIYCTDGAISNDGTITYYEVVSRDLNFALNDDDISYYVSGIGTCTDTDIIIPSIHNDLPVTSIGEDAFLGCRSLTSIVIPNSVTSIGDTAFYGCKSLTSIVIPDSVTRIGYHAFSDCSGITNINFKGTIAQWNNINKGTAWDYNVPTTYVQCSDGQVTI